MAPLRLVVLLLATPAFAAGVRITELADDALFESHLAQGSEEGEKGADDASDVPRTGQARYCETVVQCVGTEEADTVYKCACKPGRLGEPKCPKADPEDWASCEWASTDEWCSLNRGVNFDFSLAAPGGKLVGIADLVPAEVAPSGVRVLTDLDDTVMCSGGPLAGVDKECEGTEPHGLYPGVAEFFYALSLGHRANVVWGTTLAAPSVPFSARPGGLKALLGLKQCDKKDLLIRQKICGCPDQEACKRGDPSCMCFGFDAENGQYGKLADVKGFFVRDFDEMGHTKASNWLKFSSSVSTPAVFVGDDGQGDVTAAQMMLLHSQKLPCSAEKGCGGRVVAAFVHDVMHLCNYTECREAWAANNIFYFDNYKEAAEEALMLGLIPESSRLKVAEAFDEAMGNWTPPTKRILPRIARDACRAGALSARLLKETANRGLEVGTAN